MSQCLKVCSIRAISTLLALHNRTQQRLHIAERRLADEIAQRRVGEHVRTLSVARRSARLVFVYMHSIILNGHFLITALTLLNGVLVVQIVENRRYYLVHVLLLPNVRLQVVAD